jgi:saccharopine dehydrogenase-like NADP-dependent oxidoreductase
MRGVGSGTRDRSVAVVGGAGAMGRIVVADLAHTAASDVEIVVADHDVREARAVARRLPRRVRVVQVDAGDPARTARALGPCGVLVNACHHDFNLRVMDAALALGAHYCDLGGLFHVTKQQLRRHREFAGAGLLAACGIGSAPGIVNVMARAASDRLDEVDELHIAVGTVDRSDATDGHPLATAYSILTVLDEASQPAPLFTRGRLTWVDPLSHPQLVDFPRPVGRRSAACVVHSELATLPAFLRPKGVREVSFRIAFPGALAERLRLVHALGLTGRTPIDARGVSVAPRDVLLSLVKRSGARSAVRNEFEVLRVTTVGRRGKVRLRETHDCLVPGLPRWGIGVDIDTGAPPSIVAQMLLDGRISARGVRPPERCIEPSPFFTALHRRGMKIVRRSKKL